MKIASPNIVHQSPLAELGATWHVLEDPICVAHNGHALLLLVEVVVNLLPLALLPPPLTFKTVYQTLIPYWSAFVFACQESRRADNVPVEVISTVLPAPSNNVTVLLFAS